MFDLKLKPLYYACVSGGKDSLYMLGLILNNIDKYPLNYVIHYELEIDWPWVYDVINKMEIMCKSCSIPFYRIKPRKSWFELYNKYDFPNRRVRWCLGEYKLDCEKQNLDYVKSLNCRPVAYIGFCSNEYKRFKYDSYHIYPLAENNISEDIVYDWALQNPIFNNWYKYFFRQGCMLCPMLTRKELAYLLKYYPNKYKLYFDYVSKYEKKFNTYFWDRPCKDIDSIIKNKWLPILDSEENQISIFDFIGEKNYV